MDASQWRIFDGLIIKAEPLRNYEWPSRDDQWLKAYDAFTSELQNDYNQHLKYFNKSLKILGGDPSLNDWKKFRPLRLSREEDWADWLMHLMEHSETGLLSALILNSYTELASFIKPRATYRELTDKSRKFRADMILCWRNDRWTHIEVKIGDGHLKKTYPTSRIFREQFEKKKEQWSNYILLLDNQVFDWEVVVENSESEEKVSFITWTDVAIALRKSLLNDENLTWKVWA